MNSQPNQGRQLYIIITDFNGWAQTEPCLKALSQSSYQNYKIIVVDHGTTEETREKLSEHCKAVVRLEESPDKWWTGANITGIRWALAHGAENIMLLNNDCYVLPETISELMEVQKKRPEAIVAPIQRDYPSGRFLAINPSHLLVLGFPSRPGPGFFTTDMINRRWLEADIIAGGRGVIIPARVFEQVGLFDEDNLPHYGADHDFYLRAKKQGIPLLMVTGALVDIDNTRTTSAAKPENLAWREFLATLTSPRSHRNIKHVANLFRKHYPIKKLYWIGIALYIGRYCLIYVIKRFSYLLRR